MKPQKPNLVSGRLGAPPSTRPDAPAAHKPTNYGVERLGITAGQPAAAPPADEPAPRPPASPPPAADSDGPKETDAPPGGWRVPRPAVVGGACAAGVAVVGLLLWWCLSGDSAPPDASAAAGPAPLPAPPATRAAPPKPLAKPKPKPKAATPMPSASKPRPIELATPPVRRDPPPPPRPAPRRLPPARPRPKAPAPTPPPAPDPRPASPPPELSVSCIMRGLNGPVAIIDGRAVHIGQKVHGVKVVRIGDFSIEIEHQGKRSTIGISSPPSAAPTEADPATQPAE